MSQWISVDERLPKEKQYVLIWLWSGSAQVARIEKGISMSEREKMRRGEIENPLISISGGQFDTGRKAVYRGVACTTVQTSMVIIRSLIAGSQMAVL